MSKTTHTPGPWILSRDGYINGTFHDETRGPITGQIARTYSHLYCGIAEERANARRIVHCVNTHDELVAALREAEAGLEFAGADKLMPAGEFVPAPLLALRAVRAALSRASEGS